MFLDGGQITFYSKMILGLKMEVEVSEGITVFKFGLLWKLVIDEKNKEIRGRFGKVRFSEVVGAWKNYRKKGTRTVYYVQLLTKDRIYTITPEMDRESDVRRVLRTLKKVLGIKKIKV